MSEAGFPLFVDLFNRACTINGNIKYGGYEPEGHAEEPFVVNDVRLTTEEAMQTFLLSLSLTSGGFPNSMFRARRDIKTLIPSLGWYMRAQDCVSMFQDCSNLEIIRITDNYCAPGNMNYMFLGCAKLREVRGQIQGVYAANNVVDMFKGCVSLEEIDFKLDSIANLSLADSPNISLNSLRNIVTRGNNNVSNTVTVHADVYGKLTGGDDEWGKVFNDAVAKQIAFVSA